MKNEIQSISKCNLKKIKRPNDRKQKIIGAFFLPIVILGFYFPWIGLSIFACMVIGMWSSVKYGRKWCDYMCPRGSFLDYYLMKISPQRSLPKWFYSYKFRITFIVILFSFLTFKIVKAWPDFEGVCFAFVTTIAMTTFLSFILAFIFRARAWCVICPVGTFGGLIGGKKNRLKVDFAKCVNCTNCEIVCPMGLAPFKDKKKGELQSKDCIRCGTCVVNCPTGALHFDRRSKCNDQ